MKKASLDKKEIIAKLSGYLAKARTYSFVLFLIFVVSIYGIVMIKINHLMTAEPSEDAIASQVKAAKVPYFDKAVIKQLQSLQDNSVSVKALFEDTRNNPFN